MTVNLGMPLPFRPWRHVVRRTRSRWEMCSSVVTHPFQCSP